MYEDEVAQQEKAEGEELDEIEDFTDDEEYFEGLKKAGGKCPPEN